MRKISDKFLEGKSWAIPIERKYAYIDDSSIVVGEVFFATDKYELDDDDKRKLNIIKKSIVTLKGNGFKIKKIHCVGQADYRATDAYNLKLGERRANAVKRYFSKTGVKVSTKSIGEFGSVHPKNNRKPSLKEIMNDRKVTIAIKVKDIIAPVAIAADYSNVLANKYLFYYFNASTEMEEINNSGKVVAYNSPNIKSIYSERRYQKIKDNPIMPIVLIRTRIIKKYYKSNFECFLICKAIYVPTGEVLFDAFDSTINVPSSIEYYSQNKESGGGRGRVWRKTENLNKILRGSVIMKILNSDCNDRFSKLFIPVYNQLKGPYLNITSRVEAILSNRNLR